MTIPSLKRSTGEQETIAQLKKSYSSLSQVMMMSENVNGPHRMWVLQNNEKYFDLYLAPYLAVSKRCGDDNECWGGSVLYRSGAPFEDGYYKVILADGSRFAILAQREHLHVLVDLNGAKPPNTLGYDSFLFTVTPTAYDEPGLHKFSDAGVYFYGHGMERSVLAANCKSRGMMCGALIIGDGWQMSKDYP